MIKTGGRYRSRTCDTEVIVVKASESLADLRCGGYPMVGLDAANTDRLEPDPTFLTGNVMGKRYVDSAGAEVLVTRAGVGTLSIGTTAMRLKEATPLPASD